MPNYTPSTALGSEVFMNNKQIIDYNRTYRRIKADRDKYAVYILVLVVFAVLLIWLFIGDLTGLVSNFCRDVLLRFNPGLQVGIKSETYKILGTISYVSIGTTHPSMRLCLINAACALAVILFCAYMPFCKGRPFAIYLIMTGAIHLINSLWFIFGGNYFPYSTTTYSQLYMLQEVGIWIMFCIMTICITGIVGNKGIGAKLLTLLAVMLYSIVFGAVRYVVFIYLLYEYSVIYMALFYFMVGPMFDFLYLVMIYAFFVNRMIRIYDSRDGKEEWKWS